MSKRTAFTRYSLIVNKLRTKPASFQEIHDYLEEQSELKEEKYTVSKRTFQRDIEEIALTFGVEISYDSSDRVYKITLDDKQEKNQRMLEAFDTMSALRLNDRLSQYIHFENRAAQGTEHLHGILHCIKNSVQFEFVYQKFYDDEVSRRTLRPYALKEFKHRWYVVGADSKTGEIRTFGLDRVLTLEISNVKFTPKQGFDVNEYFKHSFGIIRPNHEQPEKVILSFTATEGKYIKSLPFHNSQKVLIDNSEEYRIELNVYVSHDFIQEILQYSNSVTVVEPKSLKRTLQEIYKSSI